MFKYNGFNLIELTVTLSVLAILMVSGLPSLSQLYKDNSLISASNKINNFTAYARSEASKLGQQLIVCKSANDSSFSSTGRHLIVIKDLNNNNQFDLNEPLLQATQISDGEKDIHIYFQSFSNQVISFNAQGLPLESGHIEICDQRGKSSAKAININLSGQFRCFTSNERSEVSCS
ncbi:MAG: type II transport protein GspH [Psychrobium sp.]|nr:type II transport protein GspH [Psychrobium sp.]